MTAFAVTFDGTRVANADNNTGWSADAETDYYFQGTGSVSEKVKTAQVWMNYDSGATTYDMETTPRIWVSKTISTNKTALDGNGHALSLGDTTTPEHIWNVYDANTYPIVGGWVIVNVDPNVAQWRDATGTVNNAAITEFGVGADFSVSSKVNNLAMDAIDLIDVGTGLTATGGDSTDTDGTFQDFIDFDEGTQSNRYGIVRTRGGILFVSGFLQIGNSAQATEFTDTGSVLVFPDHLVSNGSCGVRYDIGNTSTTITVTSCVFNGRGALYTNDDTRPDYQANGTVGALNIINSSKNGFNLIDWNSSVNSTGTSYISGHQVDANGANMTDCSFSDCTNSANTSYLIWDVNTNPDGFLDGCTFTRGTTNTHAIEFGNNSPTTLDLNNITFSGYNTANGQNDSAIHIKRTTGAVTINIAGGSTPTVSTEGATVSIVAGAVTVAGKSIDASGANVASARLFLRASSGAGAFPYQDVVTIVNSGTTATVTHASHGLATNDKVVINGANHWENNGIFQVSVSNSSVYTYTMPSDPGSSPTGTITSTFVALEGLTDTNGNISTSRVYSTAQPVVGWIRKSSGSPYYKTAPISGTISTTTGLTVSGVLIEDE